MTKLSIAVLLFSSLYLATALSDAPWAPLQRGVYENSPFLTGLTDFGGQNTLGQAFDSGLFNSAQGEVGQVLNAWQQNDERGFTYIAEPQLVLQDGSLHNSKYGIRVDPETGRRDVVYWSVQQLLEDNHLPTGTNITWNAETDAVTVTSFEGIDQFLQYQGFEPINDSNVIITEGEAEGETETEIETEVGNDLIVDVYSSWADYLHNFVGYEPQDAGIYADNEFLNNAVNNAIVQVGDVGALPNLVLNNLFTLDTLPREDETTLVRLTGDVTSDTTIGTLVAVISCANGGNCDDGALQHWYWNSFQFV